MKLPVLIISLFPLCHAFTAIVPLNQSQSWALHAKKSKKSSGKGFAKTPIATPNLASSPSSQGGESLSNGGGFSSIEDTSAVSFTRPEIDVDPNLPTEERTKAILKQQFGLRTYEDRQVDLKDAEARKVTKGRMDKIKKMSDDEFDIFMVVPPQIIKAIDAFLKAGLAITTGLFILAGFGICAEAWAVATGNVLPQNVDNFIVNVIEPNFTPGLFVLLGFSVSLGVFATAQLGSGSSVYKEEP